MRAPRIPKTPKPPRWLVRVFHTHGPGIPDPEDHPAPDYWAAESLRACLRHQDPGCRVTVRPACPEAMRELAAINREALEADQGG
jgi:hypothetical protein